MTTPHDALIIYHLNAKLDYQRADDPHFTFDVIAADLETAKKKADEELRKLFAAGELQGHGLRGVQIEPQDNETSFFGGWYREAKDFLS
jgi:hypothetical protein